MATTPQAETSKEEPGQLVCSNLQLTYRVRQLEERLVQLKVVPQSHHSVPRRRYALPTSSDELPAVALLGGIIVVPESIGSAKTYRLPTPKALVQQHGTYALRSYEFDVRNDSHHQVTLSAPAKGSPLVDGPDSVAPSSGSRWCVNVTCCEHDREAYELIRLT